MRWAAAAWLAAIALSISAQERSLHRCVNVDGKARYTVDREDIRVGEQCTPLTPQEQAKRRADAARPPTQAEEANMRSRAARMDFWRLCSELGRIIRRPDTSPRGATWERIVLAQVRIPASDVGYIRERRLRIGMDECSVVAVLGKPDAINRTNHAGGRSDQFVYREHRKYVYTENGIVRSWQE